MAFAGSFLKPNPIRTHLAKPSTYQKHPPSTTSPSAHSSETISPLLHVTDQSFAHKQIVAPSTNVDGMQTRNPSPLTPSTAPSNEPHQSSTTEKSHRIGHHTAFAKLHITLFDVSESNFTSSLETASSTALKAPGVTTKTPPKVTLNTYSPCYKCPDIYMSEAEYVMTIQLRHHIKTF